MSVCYDMIKQMNGELWAESEPGKGSTFFYSLANHLADLKKPQ